MSPSVALFTYGLPRVSCLCCSHAQLAERAAELQKSRLGALQWDDSVIDFLTEKARLTMLWPIPRHGCRSLAGGDMGSLAGIACHLSLGSGGSCGLHVIGWVSRTVWRGWSLSL